MVLRPGLQGRPAAPPLHSSSLDCADQGKRQHRQDEDERDRDDHLGYQDHDLPAARQEQYPAMLQRQTCQSSTWITMKGTFVGQSKCAPEFTSVKK